MKNKQSVITQIRFGISQLSPQNGSLQFEHICRHFVRRRICSNILPATGPVQSGGDQGRDFETFHTYLKKSPIVDNSFIGLASDKPIVFACSLEQNPANKNGKIEKDIETILEKGTTVKRIYFFSGVDIPVAKRHKLIDKIKEEKNVDLEIFDANAISEHLSDNDLFWIANQYLSISSEIYPRPIDSATWYEELLNQYKKLKEFSLTFEVFQDIKSALRFIYKDSELKIDLPFWLDKMRIFISESDRTMPVLTHQAIYEIFVASLMGLDNIENQEDDIRQYFSKLDDLKTKQDFTDATCLISFVGASSHVHETTFLKEEIETWTQNLISKTDFEIENTSDINLLCKLRELRFQQYLNGIRVGFNRAEDVFKSIDLGIKELGNLIPLIPDAPFYPLEELSKNINHYVKILSEEGIVNEELEGLASQIDELYGKRVGEITAAENLRDRALIYLDNGNELTAIRILHKAKLKWMKEETRLPLILTLLLLADSYDRLNMAFAAKYFALGAAHFAIRDDSMELGSYFVQSLNELANIEYSHGAWLNYLDLLDLLFPSILAIRKDFNLVENEDTKALLFHSAIIKYFAQRFAPNLVILVDSKIKNWNWIGEEIEEFFQFAKENYDEISEKETWEQIQEQLDFRPFNDIGKIRIISFSAYGINWEFQFKNDYQTNAIAEQAIAVLQILLVELANRDFHLLKSDVTVEIIFTDEKSKFKRKPSNDVSSWELYLPLLDGDNIDKVLNEFISMYHVFVFSILREISLLKFEDFREMMRESIVKTDLLNLTFFGKLYEDFFRGFVQEEKFIATKREYFTTPFINRNFKTENHVLLEWHSSTSPRFSEFEIFRDIDARYTKALIPLEVTSKTLFQNQIFQKNVKELRGIGWLDWQILNAVTSAVVSFKINSIYKEKVHSVDPKVFFELAQIPESQNYIEIPISLFSSDKFHFHMDVMLGSVLAAYKLQSHSTTPNLSAIREFLNQRFKFNELDEPEKSPFKF